MFSTRYFDGVRRVAPVTTPVQPSVEETTDQNLNNMPNSTNTFRPDDTSAGNRYQPFGGTGYTWE